jgi:sugar lactone lactonase YvrE
MKRRLVILIAFVGLLSACADQAATELSDPGSGIPGGGVLLVRTQEGLADAEASTGNVLFDEPAAVASPDRSLVYATADDGVIRVLDAVSGDVVDSLPAPAGTVPIAASQGGLVALITEGTAAYPQTPEGRSSTPVDIVATDGGSEQHLDLDGNFEPEAFSSDGKSLFLIEYLPAAAPDHYRVMELDLATQQISRIASPDKVPPATMQGTRLQQVWAPDQSVLYTLYTNQVSSSAPLTFVHVLNLDGKWAHCIDLPEPFGSSRPNAKALAGSADGNHLYVTDADAHRIATISTQRFAVDTTTELALPTPGVAESASASLALDGSLFVSGGNQIAVINTDSMIAGPTWESDSLILGSRVSADGTILYVATGNAIQGRDPRTGTPLGAIQLPGATEMLDVSGP